MIRAWLSRTFELQDPRHGRLLPMEGLRGVAVTLVFLQHYTAQAQIIGQRPGFTADIAGALRNYGNIGVILFFVLSGYLIYGHLVRRAPSFATFMARRIQRIYPAFLLAFAIGLAINLLLPGLTKIPPGSGPAALYILENLVFAPGLLPIPPIVAVAWTLSYEMFFYIATAAVVLSTGMSRMRKQRRIAVLLTVTVLFAAASLAHIPGFPYLFLTFFAGMLLAEGIGQRVPEWLAWAAPIAGIAVGVSRILHNAPANLFQTMTLFLLCAVCFRGNGPMAACMTWAPLRWLGNMSYSYYLFHGFVVQASMIALAHLLPGGLPDWLFWAFMPLVYAATLAAAALVFIAVEKPLSLRPARKPTRETVPG